MQQRQKEKEHGRFRKKAMHLLESGKRSVKRILTLSKKSKELDEALIVSACNGNNVGVMRLIRAGANIAARDNEDRTTALLWAARNGYTKTCALLISEYTKANGNIKRLIAAKDNKGRTATKWAARNGHTQIVQLFDSMENMQESMGKEAFSSFLSAFNECVS
jgi:hypothetical protein